ncbi:E3 ubiquitin-protein ligase TTC3 [Gouania willdenowi]|uniref:E3 ubiquitin-protein ligase TTC3 n=1 Tax=Gouania willdenowi TaxID=441366 RepID=UPI00105689F1|nr:E3 ubiquitin-protein ligase TTC3-like [Gouania willdenowi]
MADYQPDYDEKEDCMFWSKLNNDSCFFFTEESRLNKWKEIPLSIKYEAIQRMKICRFWLPIFLQRDQSNDVVAWAVDLRLINSKDSDELTLRNLERIDIVETVIQAVETSYLDDESLRKFIRKTHLLNRQPMTSVMDGVLSFLEGIGDFAGLSLRLAHLGNDRWSMLLIQQIIKEFSNLYREMTNNVEETMKELKHQPSESQIEKSEEMKKKGNENFQKMQYEDAVKFYTKAISYYPDNHIIYGNRALCYIRCKKYLKAVFDGKRAILIKPLWPKGHYRYCEALFLLGQLCKAIHANATARFLCKESNDGIKDLEEQHSKFETQFNLCGGSFGSPKNIPAKSCAASKQLNKDKISKNGNIHKVSNGKTAKQTAKMQKTAPQEVNTKDVKSTKSERLSEKMKPECNSPAKDKTKNKRDPGQKSSQKKADSKIEECEKLRSMVQDGYTALVDLRCRNAEQAFSKALALLETVTPKDLGLSTVDILLLLFGRASALTEIGQPEELSEAKKVLEKVKSYEERTFHCLTYYAIGRVYVRQNRFAVALENFLDSLQMVKNQILPGKLTWPLTKEVVKETQLDYFKDVLNSAIETCRFPPPPDAICRFETCLNPLKTLIYFTDPDFKGFIQICCSQRCKIEYHINCWKTLKSSMSVENEKSFLLRSCLTQSCGGQICNIKIFGPTGLAKYQLESVVPKFHSQKKPKVNQKCTSLKKLNSKEQRKKKRKLKKQSLQGNVMSDEILKQGEDQAAQSQQKAWLLYRDRVLLQISQNIDLLKEETALQVSVVTRSLKPWLELDSLRGNQIAGQMLEWSEGQMPSLGQAVELLLERKNRVWARVFIQELSICADVNPKLSSWACQLNDAGLAAAGSFIDSHAEHLEHLDLSLLLNFSPLQDAIIEKLGARPELFSTFGLTVTEYFKQAQPPDARMFIWTLEEHRDDYVSCHNILDEYFDMISGHCSVIKKSDENENISSMKAKSRGRKKKQKESKGVIVLSGMRAATSREDWNQEPYEDDSLSFLDPDNLFSVPSHLREEVADFEDQYNSSRHGSDLIQILDNNPDPTKESLYDYFAQILDKHGPLEAEDPLLVGELDNFPAEARQKIEECGSFESFLLNSLRFMKMGLCIGLAHHAVSLQQAGHGASLDDLDDLVEVSNSEFHSHIPDFYMVDASLVYPMVHYSPPMTELYRMLPNPYTIPFYEAGNNTITPGTFDHDPLPISFLPERDYETVVDGCEPGLDVLNGTPVAGGNETFLKKDAEVQTQEITRTVAVNTEIYERYEKVQGGINRHGKAIKSLEEDIKVLKLNINIANKPSDIKLLEEDLQKMTTNIQVTNKELLLFQQKLEEEVKRDQKEKKANQEALKSLKQETEKLVGEQESLNQNIRETKSNYEAKLTDFLELSNQLAAEKMSLEDEIERCKTLLKSSYRRSSKALLTVVESSRDEDFYILHREKASTKVLLNKLEEALHKVSNQDLEMKRNDTRATLEEIEKKISNAEQRFQMQMDQVRSGRKVKDQLEPAAAAAAAAVVPLAQASLSTQPSAAASNTTASNASPRKPLNKTVGPPPNTVFNRAVEKLNTMFPDYSRSDLMGFIQELRSSSGGSLSSMALPDVVNGVTQLILDHQERLSTAGPHTLGRMSPAQRAKHPLAPPVWQAVGQQRSMDTSALNEEDPCIICHEEMTSVDTCVLECRHSFHNECIRSWLREQSTCPTCRTLALLPEEFPALTGRRHQAP